MSTTTALVVSLLLLLTNGFFVAAEFALVTSKRYRLEEAALAGKRSARAALRASHELSLMLAGAQLGITLCSLGLGALAEPAIAHLFEPTLHSLGLPDEASHVVAFVISLAIVVFLHMVIGEMAPKSWAITHPERSAMILALPFLAFAKATRYLLAVLNAMANVILRIFKVEPQQELAQAHGPRELRALLDESHEHGTIEEPEHELLTSMLRLQQTTVGQVMIPWVDVVSISVNATLDDVERLSLDTGRSRLLVTNFKGRALGVLHVRDAVIAGAEGKQGTAGSLMGKVLMLPADRNVAFGVAEMRKHRAQLAVVVADGHSVGVVALEDLLEQILGEFDDETDAMVAAAS